jgi:hypothetical protein
MLIFLCLRSPVERESLNDAMVILIIPLKYMLAFKNPFNLLKAKLNSICHLLALLVTHPILHVSRIRVNY